MEDESERQRVIRNFEELLQELRVAQTGNQILFAFLLTLAYMPRFEQAAPLERVVYAITLLAVSFATALIIAPVSFHRIRFRSGAKPEILRAASWMAVIGLAFTMVALLGALYLALVVVFGRSWSVALTAGAGTFYIVMWYIIPFVHKMRK